MAQPSKLSTVVRWVVTGGLFWAALSSCTGEVGSDPSPRHGGDASPVDDAGGSSDSGRRAPSSDGGAGDSGGGESDSEIEPPVADGGVPTDSSAPDGSSTPTPTPTGGAAAYRGRLLVSEPFEDTRFGSRGWYDSTGGTVVTSENAPGGTGGALECRFSPGARGCDGGTPARHAIDEVDALFFSVWVKHSRNWVGSGRAYHPHIFYFVTNVDGDYVGPAMTHLTLYVEHVNGRGVLALGDGLNVDTSCVLRNDDSFVGCGGSFGGYAFTENRSVASCNGLMGDVDRRECFRWDASSWYSARAWRTRDVVFGPDPGPTYLADWHHIEAYFALNSVSSGTGRVDGSIRYWFDGELQVSSDRILFRTGAHPSMLVDQLMMLPYIGDGSPVDQTMFIDELRVYEGVRP